MTLLEEVAAVTKAPGPVCGVPKLLETLDEPFRSELAEAVDTPDVTARALARVLRDKYAIRLTDFTINRHRRRDCSCR